MKLVSIVRAITAAKTVPLAIEAVGAQGMKRAEKVGAVVYDGSTVCLTEVGYLLTRATFPSDVAEALEVGRLLTEWEQL